MRLLAAFLLLVASATAQSLPLGGIPQSGGGGGTLCPGGSATMSVPDGGAQATAGTPQFFNTVTQNVNDIILVSGWGTSMSGISASDGAGNSYTSLGIDANGVGWAYAINAGSHGAFSNLITVTCTGTSFCNGTYALLRNGNTSTVYGQTASGTGSGTTMSIGSLTGATGSTFVAFFNTTGPTVTHDAAWTIVPSNPSDAAAAYQSEYKIASSVTAQATQASGASWYGRVIEICAAP